MSAAAGSKVFAIVVALALTIAAWLPQVDTPAMGRVETGMQQALATFAVARALNASISMAQGTEFTVGLGAQATLGVGQVLDPVNDLVESFSNLMLIAAVALGVQKILLLIGQHIAVKIAVTAVILAWAIVYAASRQPSRWLGALLALALVVRFAVPVATLATDAIYATFLRPHYEQSTQVLNESSEALGRIVESQGDGAVAPATGQSETAPPPAETTPPAAATVPEPPAPAASWWDAMAGVVRDNAAAAYRYLTENANAAASATSDNAHAFVSLMKGLDPRPYLAQLKDQAGQMTERVVDLMVVFLLQTLLMPLFFLWAIYTVLRAALRGLVSAG
jgi:hypothetical protein